ncbi:TylF/MycF/NovP-related O-methyltransferase [Azospirillum sp. B4]|uniref:TylF/MycF/NovP-related O-methyltransferase n=1 Tax=Azospirillum sp. B4 TaxID=95605 RepID=UPI0009FE8B2D|nr:TylF/MycF/NovP-related O-methyltransferase [Azospirillum sp. B4]
MDTQYSRVSVIAKATDLGELDSYLTTLHENTNLSLSNGRNTTAGYTRGWGLEFGGLSELIAKDPIYSESYELARGWTLLPEHKLMNIFLIMKYGAAGMTGDILECGSYRGGGAVFMANIARRLGRDATVYALDTFSGMPATDRTLDLHFIGNFDDVSYEDVSAYVKSTGLTNIKLVQGLFQDTLPSVLKSMPTVSLAHIDCDIHSAVDYCVRSVQSKLNPAGGYLVFDDPLQGSCLGALQAVEEWSHDERLYAEQAYPHLVYRFPPIR